MQYQGKLPIGFTSPDILSGLPKDTPILVAFSGGADSSALLSMTVEYARQSGAKIYAAHVNHCIRGDEADRDEEFCRKAAAGYGIEIFVLRADVPKLARERGESIETAARNVRYEFFSDIMKKHSIPILATAHNANDNLETVIFNIARGCALGGVCGIPNSRSCDGGVLIRPILGLKKEDILAYCADKDLSFVTDSTNTDTDYTRNKIRSKIIPLIEEINSGAVDNTTRLCESLRDDALCLESMSRWFLDEMRDGFSLEAEKLLGSPPAIANRALIELYFEISEGKTLEHKHIAAIRELARRCVPHSSIDLPCGISAVIENKKVNFTVTPQKRTSIIDYHTPIFEGNNVISQTDCEIFMGNSQKKINIYKKAIMLYLDSAKICGSIYARPRKEGDRIRMSGMSKSLKKLMCDKKLPLELRNRIPIICDDNGILAVPLIGIRDGAKARSQNNSDELPDGTVCLQILLN